MARPTPTQTRELDRAARSLRHEITQIRELLDHRETDAAARGLAEIVAPVPACQCEHIVSLRLVAAADAVLDIDHEDPRPVGSHGYLDAPAGSRRAHHVGAVCDECATGHLADYLRLVFAVLSEGAHADTAGMAWFSLAGEAISYLRSRGGDELANRFRAELMSRRYAPLADERDTSGGVQ